MLITPPAQRKSKRSAKPKVAPVAAPTGPTLISARYHSEDAEAVLTFDQPVTVVSFVAGSITLNDENDNVLYEGSLGGAVGQTVLNLDVDSIGQATPGLGQVINAAANTGVVATSNGVAWAGVTNFPWSEQ